MSSRFMSIDNFCWTWVVKRTDGDENDQRFHTLILPRSRDWLRFPKFHPVRFPTHPSPLPHKALQAPPCRIHIRSVERRFFILSSGFTTLSRKALYFNRVVFLIRDPMWKICFPILGCTSCAGAWMTMRSRDGRKVMTWHLWKGLVNDF